jgi:hypothetical protein
MQGAVMQCAVIMQCIVDWRSADAMMQHVIVTANGDKNGQRALLLEKRDEQWYGEGSFAARQKNIPARDPEQCGGT